MSYKAVAVKIYILKPMLNVISIGCLGFIAYLFLFSTIARQNQYGLPCLVLAAWCLLLSALLGLLVNAPALAGDKLGWFARMRFKLMKKLFALAVIVFFVLTLALLYLSFRLLNL